MDTTLTCNKVTFLAGFDPLGVGGWVGFVSAHTSDHSPPLREGRGGIQAGTEAVHYGIGEDPADQSW